MLARYSNRKLDSEVKALAMEHDERRRMRAVEFAIIVKASGLTLAEFGRRCGLTRNVTYVMTKGRKPSPQEEQAMKDVIARARGSKS